jgi:hypothetical protein
MRMILPWKASVDVKHDFHFIRIIAEYKANYNTCKLIYDRGYHVLWNNVSFLGRILPLGDKTKEVQI